MNSKRRIIPQPVPADSLPPPDLSQLHSLDPAPLRVTQVITEAGTQLAVILKRTYDVRHGQNCPLSDEKAPLDETGILHDEMESGTSPSSKSLPEVVGFKTGTDLVIQASARPPYPQKKMPVSVRIGPRFHEALVMGPRRSDRINGKILFSEPEAFEAMELRYENAYGGPDKRFMYALMEEVKTITPAEHLRRASPAAEALLSKNHPLLYPRNRFGKGYVLEDRREFIEDRALPNIELPGDLLTPERLVLGHFLDWPDQPLPAGFDFLDPLSFPRSAMLGMPQPTRHDLNQVREVTTGLIPTDYCKGNAASKPLSDIPGMIHDMASRCASLGLWFPFLRGKEEILLAGMDPEHPEFQLRLPEEKPIFTLNGSVQDLSEIEGRLYLIHVNMADQRLYLIWTGHRKLKRPLLAGEAGELEASVRVSMERI